MGISGLSPKTPIIASPNIRRMKGFLNLCENSRSGTSFQAPNAGM